MMDSSPDVAETIEVSARGEHVAPIPAPPIMAEIQSKRSALVATAKGTTTGIIMANVVQPPPIANAVAAQSRKRIVGVITGGMFPWKTDIMNSVMPSLKPSPLSSECYAF